MIDASSLRSGLPVILNHDLERTQHAIRTQRGLLTVRNTELEHAESTTLLALAANALDELGMPPAAPRRVQSAMLGSADRPSGDMAASHEFGQHPLRTAACRSN